VLRDDSEFERPTLRCPLFQQTRFHHREGPWQCHAFRETALSVKRGALRALAGAIQLDVKRHAVLGRKGRYGDLPGDVRWKRKKKWQSEVEDLYC